MEKIVAQVENVGKYFTVKKSFLHKKDKILKAVDDISLKIYEGETVSLVGESGCGKSTLGRIFLKLHTPTFGKVEIQETVISDLNKKEVRKYRDKMQMVFQDPYASLNPRMTIFNSVKAPLDAFHIGTKEEREKMVLEILQAVGIPKAHVNKYPNELSGGQRQRIVIARAMILNPDFVVCDEPVSALDVSVRAQVLNLMKKLQQETNVSYLFISHDLSVVRYLSDRIVVMYLGRVVEVATKEELFDTPIHPYTKALLSAIPIPDVNVKRKKVALEGDVPSPLNPPSGCAFHTRCPYATEECSEIRPELREVSAGEGKEEKERHMVACLQAEKFMKI